ncbi:SDR family NAD(P)-dependent oxidoreductase [Alkalimarinus coralli]|uniref:SDR family NAD(P)-dependent oxidoreductase n=1 Tax=Alkalimarinus coralli TaxID=2935863 RepID=UPI00202B7E6B|nr:SDR family NAD(P)-dependent oxidoreductase [Alkalimarinus coralli]
MNEFNGKVAAITGAASGIGRALALELATQGCHLALCDVDKKGLKETSAEAAAMGVNVTTKTVDVANRKAVHDWADAVVKDHGKVNMIFNNAGVALGGTVEETTYEDYEWIIGINLWGVIYGTKAFLPYIKQAAEPGHIVNISSVFGLFSQPTQSGYNLSKFAVRGFTESLRQELDLEQCDVTATSIHPGGIQTNIARNARMTQSVENLTGNASAENLRDQFESLFMTTPEKAANVILKGIKSKKRRVLIGPDAKVLDMMQRCLPVSYQRLVTSSFKWVSR